MWLVSSRVLIDEELKAAAIRISDGFIAYIGTREEAEASSEELIDYGDLVICPGVVDSHVHVNEPGRTEWEGFVSATRAAAAGGVTTIVDMPLNSVPYTTSVTDLNQKVEVMEGKLWVDVGLLGGIVPGNEGEIGPMIEAGVLGFKSFMCDSGIPEFPPVNEKQIEIAMQEIKKSVDRNIVYMFHAEAELELAKFSPSMPSFGKLNPRHYSSFLYSRPASAEDEAIQKVIALTNANGVRSHIVHLSSSSALSSIKEARDAAVTISAETTYHYLYFCSEEIGDDNTTLKCCPPIRTRENRDLLWNAVKEGTITQLCSDHSPCTTDLKTGDFFQAWGGIASLQIGLPAMWTRASEYGLSIPELFHVMSKKTAELVSLDHIKGSIQQGKHADFVVWDPEATFEVNPEFLEMKNKLNSPYLGETLKGKVHATYVRGTRVYNNEAEKHEILDRPCGQWLRKLYD